MVAGFDKAEDFAPIIGWELFQVTLDKYHVMFYFENGWQLLNVAHSFSHNSADGSVDYTYEIYGQRKRLELDRLLRRTVVEVVVKAQDRLGLIFDNGDNLVIYDDPETRSWWFMPIPNRMFPNKSQWAGLGDIERWPGEFGQVVKWIFCLSAARMPRIRSKNDQASTPEPQPGFQGEGGIGSHQGREDAG